MENTSVRTVPTTVPSELRDRQQWVCWRYAPRDGKPPTKVPCSPRGGPASVTDVDTWASHKEAIEACRAEDHDGVGFVLSRDDPFAAIDLDGCRDPQTGELEGWAQEPPSASALA